MIARTFVTPFQGLSDVVTETQGVAVVPQITSSFPLRAGIQDTNCASSFGVLRASHVVVK
jgi:hypothetical protein